MLTNISIIFFLLLLLGAPIFLVLTMAGTYSMLCQGIPQVTIPQVGYESINSFILVAVPLFLLGGNIMARGEGARRLVEACDAFLGHLPGGLATIVVITGMWFASISGSSTASAAALGRTLIKPMSETGYGKRFTMGLIAASGTLGILIPPSIPLVLYGAITEQSVSKLFIAGIVPGIILGLMLIVGSVIFSWRKGYKRSSAASWQERKGKGIRALPIMMFPVIIWGGLYGGYFTPTEAAAVACVYALGLEMLLFKELNLTGIRVCLIETAKQTAMIYFIIMGALILGYGLTFSLIPQKITGAILSMQPHRYLFLLFVGLLYLIMGMFLEVVAITYMTIPLLFPVLAPLGINPIHFGIIYVVIMEIALITPPVGLNLYVVAGIEKTTLEEVSRGVFPFIPIFVAHWLLIVFCPVLSIWLPSQMG